MGRASVVTTSKPLLEWQGRPLVAWAVDAAVASGLGPVLVVVGYRGDEVRAALPPDVEVVDNPEWEEGIVSSLRAALDACSTPRTDVDAVAVGLADQPLRRRRGVPRAWPRPPASADLGSPPTSGGRGNPVLLARSLWPEAMRLRGDTGARTLMRDGTVDRIECGDTGSAADIDTLEDLERMQQEDQ